MSLTTRPRARGRRRRLGHRRRGRQLLKDFRLVTVGHGNSDKISDLSPSKPISAGILPRKRRRSQPVERGSSVRRHRPPAGACLLQTPVAGPGRARPPDGEGQIHDPIEQTIVDLGIATEVQVAEALARYAGPQVRQNQPARSRPRRRHDRAVRTVRPAPRADRDLEERDDPDSCRPRSARAVPGRRHSQRHRPRGRASGCDTQRRRGAEPRVLRAEDEPEDGGKAAHLQLARRSISATRNFFRARPKSSIPPPRLSSRRWIIS